MKLYTITYMKAGHTFTEDVAGENLSDARIKFMLRMPEVDIVTVATKNRS